MQNQVKDLNEQDKKRQRTDKEENLETIQQAADIARSSKDFCHYENLEELKEAYKAQEKILKANQNAEKTKKATERRAIAKAEGKAKAKGKARAKAKAKADEEHKQDSVKEVETREPPVIGEACPEEMMTVNVESPCIEEIQCDPVPAPIQEDKESKDGVLLTKAFERDSCGEAEQRDDDAFLNALIDSM